MAMVRYFLLSLVALSLSGCSLLLDFSGEGVVCSPQEPCLSGFACTEGTCRKVDTGSLKPGINVLDSLQEARTFHAAAMVGNPPKVLVSGGLGSAYLKSCELFDPETRTWRTTASLGSIRGQHVTVTLADDRVLVVGGRASNADTDLVKAVEIYDGRTGLFTSAGSLSSGRTFHTVEVLRTDAEKRVVVAGGNNATQPTEVFTPLQGAWRTDAPLKQIRYRHRMARIDSRLLVMGGQDTGNQPLNSYEIFNAQNLTWEAGTSPMKQARYDFTATALVDGRVLVVGGVGPSSQYLSSAEWFDPKTSSWTATSSMKTARARHAAALVDGKVIVAGGQNASGFLDSVEVFDPATSQWTEAGTLSVARHHLTATELRDKSVLFVGGEGAAGPSAAVELYVP